MASPALAQVAAGAPTREEIDRGRMTAPPAVRPSRLTVEGGVERAPCPLADPRFADVKITISGAQFNNLQAVPAEALSSAWQGYVGREVPVATVCEMRDAAATILREKGYLAAVQVPPQRIEKDGVVTFDVLMAKLTAIQVRGDAGNSEKLIAAHLEALRDQPVFNIHEAERHLLLARDLPGYDVRLVLRPANAGPGEVIGEVQVTQQKVQLDVNIQNYGSREVGRFGGLARLQVNDITGMGDMTVLSVFNTFDTEEQTVIQGGHSFFVGTSGLRLSGDLTYAWSNPDVANGAIKSETLIGTLAASYPLVRRQSETMLLTGGLDIVDQKVRFGATPLTADHVRVLFARMDFDRIDAASLSSTLGYSAAEPLWRLSGSLEARQGISMLGASKACGVALINCRPPRASLSRLEADPSAFIVRASFTGEYRPIPTLAVAVTPRLQYSPDVLVSYEEASAGNYTVGRGYDPGTLTGDSLIGITAEMRLGSIMPRSANDLAFQPFAFVDAAWTWNKDAAFNGLDPQRLTSVGGGVRAAWGNRARIDVALAVPLERAGLQTKKGDVRLLVSLTSQLVPWSQ